MRVSSVVSVSMLVLVGCSNAHLNLPPVVADLAFETMEDTVATATLDATDPDRDGLLVEVATAPAHGVVEISGRTITYTPEANFHGDDGLTLTVYDSKNPRETATVSITVLPVNDAPVGEADTIAATEDLPRTIAASALVQNDTDIDGEALTITGVSAATHGAVALTGINVVFTPDLDFVGEGSFEYTLSDGTATATVAVTVDIGGENDAPVASNDAATTAEDTPVDVTNLLANDTDADGQVLTVDSALAVTGGTVSLSGNTVTFTPDENFNGAATFSYVVTDGVASDTATVTVTVTAVNDAPVAIDDSPTAINEDTPTTFTALAANDSDVDLDTLSVSAVSNPMNGAVALNGGQPIFTPASNYNGSASFDYTISDGAGGTDTATVTITVTAVNDAPVAVDDSVTTDEDVQVTFTSLLSNDIDVDIETLTIANVFGCVSCSVSLSNGDVLFTPNADFNGTATFSYTVSDALGATDTGSVTVTVVPVVDIAVASVTPSAVDVLASGTAILAVNVVEPAPSGGIVINLSSGTSEVTVPSSVTVPEGATSATFRILAGATPTVGAITITATLADGGSSKTAAATVVATAPAPVSGDLVINEIHYDVLTTGAGDANCDGINDAQDDEFVELSNRSSHPVQMLGASLWDANAFAGSAPVYTFPAFALGAGETVVVFGGAVGTTGTSVWCTNLDGTHIGDARALPGPAVGDFGLNNSGGETVHLTATNSASSAALVTAVALPTTSSKQAFARNPDFTGAFVKDGTGIGASDRNWSPGTLVTGQPFAAASP